MGVPVHALTQSFDDDPDEASPPVEMDAAERDRLFAELAERQARFMYRVAHGLLRSVQDSEDAVQEALLKLYRSDGWLRIEDERAFLARTVYRTGLDVIARRQKATDSMDFEAERELVWEGRSPEQNAVDDDDRAMLRALIDGLSDDFRQALVLSAIEEMTSREVALAMGIPEATVRTRVMRARADLKRRFEAMQGTKGERR